MPTNFLGHGAAYIDCFGADDGFGNLKAIGQKVFIIACDMGWYDGISWDLEDLDYGY